ncbi:hypothetical protein NQ318_018852 [Aromia moschata]|uniref:Transposase n=1 Tax=Aromia moschata TaxID=1265417 RepID=A0AAV8ZHL7_9CUCU|nr:hypothetical protein NQ318_018852 [Aromia moschata]
MCRKCVPKDFSIFEVVNKLRPWNGAGIRSARNAAPQSRAALTIILISHYIESRKGKMEQLCVTSKKKRKAYCMIEVLTALRECVRRRRHDLWKTKSWKIHQDNAPAHSVLRFFAKYGITVLEHPPYSSDLAPLTFLFPKVKSALKRTRFDSVEAVNAKATEVLSQLTEADFQHCLQQWKSRMERCRDRQGEYVEGEKVATEIGNE